MTDINAFLTNPPTQIVTIPNPILTQKCVPVTNFDRWKEVFSIMLGLVKNHAWAGLAAPQVGLSYRAFLVASGLRVAINPEIIERDTYSKGEAEGCLSIPGVRYWIYRSRRIKVKWQDLSGKQHCQTYEGFMARVFQHEIDHLDGILINAKEAGVVKCFESKN